uniref:Uncharacterized protein n=1 Tax=Glossina palpalis gambiensis TaxID=67801 RepID=A0A1B0BWE1_9MUSC
MEKKNLFMRYLTRLFLDHYLEQIDSKCLSNTFRNYDECSSTLNLFEGEHKDSKDGHPTMYRDIIMMELFLGILNPILTMIIKEATDRMTKKKGERTPCSVRKLYTFERRSVKAIKSTRISRLYKALAVVRRLRSRKKNFLETLCICKEKNCFLNSRCYISLLVDENILNHKYRNTREVFCTFCTITTTTTTTTLILTMKAFLPLNDWLHRVMEWKVLKLAEIDCLKLEKKEELFVAVEMPFVAEQQIAVARRRPCLKIDSHDNGPGARLPLVTLET